MLSIPYCHFVIHRTSTIENLPRVVFVFQIDLHTHRHSLNSRHSDLYRPCIGHWTDVLNTLNSTNFFCYLVDCTIFLQTCTGTHCPLYYNQYEKVKTTGVCVVRCCRRRVSRRTVQPWGLPGRSSAPVFAPARTTAHPESPPSKSFCGQGGEPWWPIRGDAPPTPTMPAAAHTAYAPRRRHRALWRATNHIVTCNFAIFINMKCTGK